MKKLKRKHMNKILITTALTILTSLPAFTHAAGVQFGRIVDIKGSGFISYEGQTHEIKKGEALYVNSEIIVESSGQVTFTDNADHRFFIGNASTAAIYSGKVELRSGDLWMQSLNKVEDYKLTTANAVVNYQGGEAILSYDSVKGKTQLMVINGLMKFSNLRAPELNLTVSEGNFSFVDLAFEEGMPRDPTPVGEKTYGQLVAIFPGVSPMDKRSAEIFKDSAPGKSRSIASVAETHHEEKTVSKKPEAIELEKEYKAEIMNLKKTSHVEVNHKKIMKKSNKAMTTKLVVQIYGLAGSEKSATTAIYDLPNVVAATASTVPATSNRAPASVNDVDATVVDQAVPKAENMNKIPTTPQYKESEKLMDQLNKL
jgi:hypothetical protein